MCSLYLSKLLVMSSPQRKIEYLLKLLLLTLVWSAGVPSSLGGACKSPPKKVYLVRHAHKASQEGPLSKKGWEMADKLAHDERLQKVTQIYVSDKVRTQQTALALAKKLGIVPIVVPFRDRDQQVEIVCSQGPSEEILIIGHSNNLPNILGKLGLPKVSPDYCELLVLDQSQLQPPVGGRPTKDYYCVMDP